MRRKMTDIEKRLMGLTYKSDFENVVDELMLSDEQELIFRMYYFNQRRMIDIGQDLPIYRTEQYVSKQLSVIKDKLSNYVFEV